MQELAEPSAPLSPPHRLPTAIAHPVGGWGKRWLMAGLCAVLVLLIAGVYAQTAHFEFVNLDDDQYVTNSAETQLGLSPAGVAWAWTHSQVGNWHPITTLSFMLDWQLFGPNPAGYHVHNVILHAASSVLLLLFLRRMTGALWLSALAAFVFAIHPLRAESVAWVTERKDVLSGLYFVLTLYAYAIYTSCPSLLRYAAVLVFFALGLMSKAMLVTLPVIMLLLDYWPLQRLAGVGPGQRKVALGLLLEKIPLFLLAMTFSAITAYHSLSAQRVFDIVPLPVRLANAPLSCVTYLAQYFCPVKLAANYPYAENGPPVWQVIAACLLLLGISGTAVAFYRKGPWLLVGWLWYLITLLPVIGLIPGGNQLMADRYTYISQIGLTLALLWSAAAITASWPHRGKLAAAMGVAIIAALAAGTYRQTAYWRNSETLWRHALSCTSGNAIAHDHLAGALQQLARAAEAAGNHPLAQSRLAEAKVHFQQALEIMPTSLPALCNLANQLNDEGRPDEAIVLLVRAVKANPKQAEAHYNLGCTWLRLGAANDAIASFQRAIELAPLNAPAHNNLANILCDKGRFDEGVEQYRLAIAANPEFIDAYTNLGNALMRQGKLDEAQSAYHLALAHNPQCAPALSNLGDIARDKGQLDTAVSYYQNALQADPRYLAACNNWGDVLDRQGKHDEAIAVYRQATRIDPHHVVVWYNLGICQEQRGKVDDAVASFQKALELATAQGNAALAQTIREKINTLSQTHP